MFYEWTQLKKQGSKPIAKYITKFNEYFFHCNVEDDEFITLSYFIIDFHGDLRRELISRKIYNFQDAYEMVQNFDNLIPTQNILIIHLNLMPFVTDVKWSR